MTVMRYRAARFTGAPVMECPDCGAVCAYWDADDMTPNPVTGVLELQCDGCAGEDYARCPACGEPVDYCAGHGPIGDPAGAAILDAHDNGDHAGCHPVGCPDAGRWDATPGCAHCGAPDHVASRCHGGA
jgi:hypothetical protein